MASLTIHKADGVITFVPRGDMVFYNRQFIAQLTEAEYEILRVICQTYPYSIKQDTLYNELYSGVKRKPCSGHFGAMTKGLVEKLNGRPLSITKITHTKNGVYFTANLAGVKRELPHKITIHDDFFYMDGREYVLPIVPHYRAVLLKLLKHGHVKTDYIADAINDKGSTIPQFLHSFVKSSALAKLNIKLAYDKAASAYRLQSIGGLCYA